MGSYWLKNQPSVGNMTAGKSPRTQGMYRSVAPMEGDFLKTRFAPLLK